MKKLTGLIAALLIGMTCFAGEITFVKNMTWKQIREKARKENKMIFFDAYASWCGPCKYLDSDVYTHEEVAAYYNANFINVKFDMEEGEGLALSEEFEISSYPTLMFFSPDGKMVHKYIGALEPGDFIDLGKDAKDPAQQYFTLKEKAKKLQMDDASFLKWVEKADKMEDEDLDDIVSAFLKTKKDLLANADLANITLLYASDLTNAQLKQLFANKNKIATLENWTKEKASIALYNILFRKGWYSYSTNNNNVDSFRVYFRTYDPAREKYAVKDLKFRVAVNDDPAQAVTLLKEYLNDKKDPSTLEDLAGWAMDYSSMFDNEHFEEINAAFKNFSFRAIDKDKEYWSYLVQLLCEIKLGNEDAARIMGEKAYKHPHLPMEFKEVLENSYGFHE